MTILIRLVIPYLKRPQRDLTWPQTSWHRKQLLDGCHSEMSFEYCNWPIKSLTSSTLSLWTVTLWLSYRALSTRTTRHRNSFFPHAIHLMNTWITQHCYTLLYSFITHIYFFISNLHIADLYTHNCLYYILYFFTVILLHCRAVTITNSSYV